MSERGQVSDLQIFLAVAELGSLSAAVRTTGLSQPTLGRRLVAYERRLGVVLFERSLVGYALTPAGRHLVASAEGVAAAEARFLQHVEEAKHRERPIIRIRAGEWTSRLVAQSIERLQAAAPECELALLTQGAIDDESIELGDLVIRAKPVEKAGFVRRHIGRVAYAAFAKREFFAKHRPKAGDSIFNVGRWALWCRLAERNGVLCVTREWGYPEIGGEARILPCTSVQVLLNAVASGNAFGFLPTDIGNREGLVQVSDRIEALEHDYWLCFRTESRRRKNMLAVARLLASHLQKHLCN